METIGSIFAGVGVFALIVFVIWAGVRIAEGVDKVNRYIDDENTKHNTLANKIDLLAAKISNLAFKMEQKGK